MASAVLPRWWDISPAEIHAATLYQRAGEELLTASVKDEDLRSKVVAILANRMLPQHSRQVEARSREQATFRESSRKPCPPICFISPVEFREKYPDQFAEIGSATQELQELCAPASGSSQNWRRMSHDFGIPHPAWRRTMGSELLNVLPMPPFAGEANRFLAESWDSPNLYWARLADERGYSPVMLNHLVPELTRMMVERIFATEFEDWPALLRAMHEAGMISARAG